MARAVTYPAPQSQSRTKKPASAQQRRPLTAAGYFRFTALPARSAHQCADVVWRGSRTAVQEHIRLQVAETKTINVTLEAGQVQEQVTVGAAAPLVETSEGRVSGVIEESQVRDLPLLGRNFFNLVVLTPGVTGRAAGGGRPTHSPTPTSSSTSMAST